MHEQLLVDVVAWEARRGEFLLGLSAPGGDSLDGLIAAFYQKVFVYDWSAEQTGEACACGDAVAVPYRASPASHG